MKAFYWMCGCLCLMGAQESAAQQWVPLDDLTIPMDVAYDARAQHLVDTMNATSFDRNADAEDAFAFMARHGFAQIAETDKPDFGLFASVYFAPVTFCVSVQRYEGPKPSAVLNDAGAVVVDCEHSVTFGFHTRTGYAEFLLTSAYTRTSQ